MQAVPPQAALGLVPVVLADQLVQVVQVQASRVLALGELQGQLVLVDQVVQVQALRVLVLGELQDQLVLVDQVAQVQASRVLVLGELVEQVAQVSMQAVPPQAALGLVPAVLVDQVVQVQALRALVLGELQDQLVLVDQVAQVHASRVLVLGELQDERVLVHVAQVPMQTVSRQAALQALVLGELQDELVPVQAALQALVLGELQDGLVPVQVAQVSMQAVSRPLQALVLGELQDELVLVDQVAQVGHRGCWYLVNSRDEQVGQASMLVLVLVDLVLLPSWLHHAFDAVTRFPSRVQFHFPAWPRPHQRLPHHRCLRLVSQLVQLMSKTTDQLKLRCQPKHPTGLAF
eukprot:s800_g15.t1